MKNKSLHIIITLSDSIMIYRAARTVVKTNHFFQITNFKQIYYFSNKQDPFKKFKKPINKAKQQTNQTSKNVQKPKQINQQKNDLNNHKQPQVVKNTSVGFDKFKKRSKSPSEQQEMSQSEKYQKPAQSQQYKNNSESKEQKNIQKPITTGFDKFNKKQTPQPSDREAQQKQNAKTQLNKSEAKNQSILQQKIKKVQNIPTGFQKFKKYSKSTQIHEKKKQHQINTEQQQQNKKGEQAQSKMKQQTNEADKIKFQKIKRPDINQVNEKRKNFQQSNKPADGFSKFKKPIKTKQEIQSINKKSQEHQKQVEDDPQKQQAILNQKSTSKEDIYQNTQKKKQQQKQQWEKFFQDQIKKQKSKKSQQTWFNSSFQNFKKKYEQKNKNYDGKSPPPPPQTPQSIMKKMFFVGLAVVLLFNMAADFKAKDRAQLVQAQQLMQMVKTMPVKQTWFLKLIQSIGDQSQSRTKQYACIELMSGKTYKCQSNSDFEIEWNRFIDKNNQEAIMFQNREVITKKPYIIKRDSHIFNFFRSVLGYGLLFMFIRSILGASKGAGKNAGKGGGLSDLFGTAAKSNRFRQTVNVKFNDVVGMNKAKQQIVQFIDFLMKPQKYNKLGARIPRGALLTGPPGTGKTMLAKACAGQGNVPFFTISGSQFMQMYVGVGAQRVRSLFKQAKQNAPSIIFIDEIDAVGKKRASGPSGGGNSERDNTLNQLLVQMDGFQTGTNVIVFAATNQKEVLDPALTRPGRFDRLIEVDLPDIQGRKQIFLVHLKPIILNQNNSVEEYAKRLATLTPGFSGADIKNLCNEAAIIAARGDKTSVSMIDFEMASQRVIGGVQKKSSLITPETRRTVAYHECGHGVVSWFMQHANPLLKLTIIPRSKGALGYAQYLPNQNQMYTKRQLMDQICVILGGRISEQIFFKKISTGASDDLQKAFKVAKTIVAEYGMGNVLNWTSYSQTQYAKQYSTSTEQKIDEEILQMIHECSLRTRLIIQDKKQLIQNLAEQLLKVQTVDQKIISSILGERPFKNSKQYQEYIRQKNKLADQNNNQPPAPSPQPQVNFKQLLASTVKLPSTKIQYLSQN